MGEPVCLTSPHLECRETKANISLSTKGCMLVRIGSGYSISSLNISAQT